MNATNNRANASLAAKVAAVNSANAESNRLHALCMPAVAALVGTKVFKADGSLTQKVRAALPADLFNRNERGMIIYQYLSRYSLIYVVKTCVNIEGGSGCHYAEASFYLGETEGDTLRKACVERVNARTDYTVGEILRLRKVAEEAAEAHRDAECALTGFGRYDR